MSRIAKSILAALFMLTLAPGLAHAQTASIVGIVTDATGAVVPGTTITVRNTATNAVRTASSNATGVYSLPNLTPGVYAITAEKEGFTQVRFAAVTLAVSQLLTLDIRMEVGAVVEMVEVSGEAVAALDLATAQVSNLVNQRVISDLPLLLRDPYQLVTLSPGVVVSNSSLGGFAVNGSSERRNNFLLDGTDNNDTSVPGIPGGATALNPDSVEEFRVITNNFSPEYGRNSGAIVDIITKSGTNDFHGTLYWFGRYDALAARDFFNQESSSDPFTRNQFGGSVGGPVVKDKTFWFFNTEIQRFSTTRTTSNAVPTAAFKAGLVRNPLDGTIIDLNNPADPHNIFGFTPNVLVQSILNSYPDPNGQDVVPGITGLLFFQQKSKQESESYTVKVDHHITPNHTLSGRYTFNQSEDPNPFFAETIPGLDGIDTFARGQNLTVALSSILTPTLINDFRAGANRIRAEFNCTSVDRVDSASPTLDPQGRGRDFLFTGLPQFGCLNLGSSNGQARFTGTYQYKDNLTWVKGSHTLKFGGEFRWVYDNSFTNFFTRDQTTFAYAAGFGIPALDLDPSTPCSGDTSDPGCEFSSNTFQDRIWSLLGLVDTQTQNQLFDATGNRTADDLRGLRQREYALFAQDTWKLLPNLTLTYGLRYEWYGVPFEVDNNFSNFFGQPAGLVPPGGFEFELVGPGSGRKFYKDDYNNFMPRFGFAWDPFKDGKTSIRGGYGLFYDRAFSNLFGNAATGNPPFVQAPFLQAFFDFPLFESVDNLGFIPTVTPTRFVEAGAFFVPVLFENNAQLPYSQNWNFGVQRELWKDLLVEVNFVGSKGTHLFRVYNGNFPQPALVQALIGLGVPESQLQGNLLYFGGDIGLWPFNAVGNNAFFIAFQNSTQATSSYHGLQLNLTKRMSRGFYMQGAFTWSHAIDWASDPLAPTAGNAQLPRDSSQIKASELGNSDFDVRRNLVVNYIWELPVGRGRSFLSDGPVGKILEGWQVSGITRFADGTPYDIFCSRDSSHSRQVDRCDLLATPNPANAVTGFDPRTQTGPLREFFDEPTFGRLGSLQRNRFTVPGTANFDFQISKLTTLTERLKLEFRTEIYNIFNRVQFGDPGNTFTDSGTFGQSTSQVGRPDGTSGARQIQFALKLHF